MAPEDYIEALPEDRRKTVRAVDAVIREALPDAPVEVASGMLGYAPYHYRYASGREGDAHLVALASRKAGLSLYVASAQDGEYLAERFAPRLGKVSVGKSCIRFRRLEDVELPVLRELLAEAGRVGGASAV